MPRAGAHVEVVTTLPAKPALQALSFVERAVRARLAACGNVAPGVRSVYWWKGEIERADEVWVSFKTTSRRARELAAWVEREHPYDVPFVAVVPLGLASPRYAAWISAETRPRLPRAPVRRRR